MFPRRDILTAQQPNSGYVLATTYRPLAARANNGSSPWTPVDRHQLTESLDTASSSNASTAACTCETRIGLA